MSRIDDILVVGVGGQGIILATDVIAEVFLRAGHDAKKSEVHGMAQRGGSVESHVRRGEEVHSPLISPGAVQVLVAMEGLEALRYAHMVSRGGIILYDPLEIPPLAVATGQSQYPEDLSERLSLYSEKVYPVPAFALASELGNTRTQNAVLIGALASLMEIPDTLWREVLSRRVPARAVDVNQEAFALGSKAIVRGS